MRLTEVEERADGRFTLDYSNLLVSNQGGDVRVPIQMCSETNRFYTRNGNTENRVVHLTHPQCNVVNLELTVENL